YLPTTVVKGVERVEELLLGLCLSLEELNVVQEQDVDVAKARLEGVGLPTAEGVEELVGERLAGRASNAEPRTMGEQKACDRAQQVGLADARRAADEEGVVRLGRHLGDGQSGRVREPIAVADHELLEGQLGIAHGGVEIHAGRTIVGRRWLCSRRSPPPPVRPSSPVEPGGAALG